MAFDVNNPYFRTKVLTASQEELRLLLLDGTLRFIREGRGGLLDKDFERVYEGFTQARAIVMELMNGLRPDVDKELCTRLQGLYAYVYRLLVDASFEKNVEKADEALKLMVYERETWALVMEKLERERAGSDGAEAIGSHSTESNEYRPLSVQG